MLVYAQTWETGVAPEVLVAEAKRSVWPNPRGPAARLRLRRKRESHSGVCGQYHSLGIAGARDLVANHRAARGLSRDALVRPLLEATYWHLSTNAPRRLQISRVTYIPAASVSVTAPPECFPTLS
jgi:hypothetical protein